MFLGLRDRVGPCGNGTRSQDTRCLIPASYIRCVPLCLPWLDQLVLLVRSSEIIQRGALPQSESTPVKHD